MNKRDTMLSLIHDAASLEYTPAAFFLHFDSAYHQGQAAIEKHLEFFRATGMDFVKIQYEQPFPASSPIRKPEDWANAPLCSEEFFEAPIHVVEGLVKAAKSDTLVIVTLFRLLCGQRTLSPISQIISRRTRKPRKRGWRS